MERKQITQLKRLTARRNNLMDKVKALDTQINELLAAVPAGASVEKQDYPKPGSGPAKLCKVMSSRPKTKEEIAKKAGLSEATVSVYLQKFNCFESAGRGKGYIYKRPPKVK